MYEAIINKYRFCEQHMLLLCWHVLQVLQEMLDMLREHESNHHR